MRKGQGQGGFSGPGITIDSAEKPPFSENSGHQKSLTKLRSFVIRHLCAKYFFLIFGKRLFQQNHNPINLQTGRAITDREKLG